MVDPERVPDLLPDVRMLKTSQQPQFQRSQGHGQVPRGLLSLVCLQLPRVQSPPAICAGLYSHPESLDTCSFPLKSHFPF